MCTQWDSVQAVLENLALSQFSYHPNQLKHCRILCLLHTMHQGLHLNVCQRQAIQQWCNTYTPTLTHPNPFRVDDSVSVNLYSLHIIFFPQPDDFSPDLNKAQNSRKSLGKPEHLDGPDKVAIIFYSLSHSLTCKSVTCNDRAKSLWWLSNQQVIHVQLRNLVELL